MQDMSAVSGSSFPLERDLRSAPMAFAYWFSANWVFWSSADVVEGTSLFREKSLCKAPSAITACRKEGFCVEAASISFPQNEES